MNRFRDFVLLLPIGLLVAPAVPVTAQTERSCMAKTTKGRPGGDHQITVSASPNKAAFLSSRGYSPSTCPKSAAGFQSFQRQMCSIAARKLPELEAELRNSYSLSPLEICEL